MATIATRSTTAMIFLNRIGCIRSGKRFHELYNHNHALLSMSIINLPIEQELVTTSKRLPDEPQQTPVRSPRSRGRSSLSYSAVPSLHPSSPTAVEVLFSKRIRHLLPASTVSCNYRQICRAPCNVHPSRKTTHSAVLRFPRS